ncbi:unnamed protein product [Vitrella brassicaformis CCMP3155]|uniref:Uncharacterized protein n=1 Tax=Vitrella brassicaformis (strain CCMP3155) TaxID=1169540 RepID=A0A0G4GMD7_VITBC|nr:unnamed protein product [Vitrella brassicaformis CCMP3155]|mmetsp:Transcript_12691/g.36863  ORF Transcript_12691/g.36863 Transcript_12691/m.36863 type:complete len:203 (+) Transcript_12691:71-679(+)|eukprot:CEM31358.1 unnamed protein product [Vitrella brassicaformis CCMP3155]
MNGRSEGALALCQCRWSRRRHHLSRQAADGTGQGGGQQNQQGDRCGPSSALCSTRPSLVGDCPSAHLCLSECLTSSCRCLLLKYSVTWKFGRLDGASPRAGHYRRRAGATGYVPTANDLVMFDWRVWRDGFEGTGACSIPEGGSLSLGIPMAAVPRCGVQRAATLAMLARLGMTPTLPTGLWLSVCWRTYPVRASTSTSWTR